MLKPVKFALGFGFVVWIFIRVILQSQGAKCFIDNRGGGFVRNFEDQMGFGCFILVILVQIAIHGIRECVLGP